LHATTRGTRETGWPRVLFVRVANGTGQQSSGAMSRNAAGAFLAFVSPRAAGCDVKPITYVRHFTLRIMRARASAMTALDTAKLRAL